MKVLLILFVLGTIVLPLQCLSFQYSYYYNEWVVNTVEFTIENFRNTIEKSTNSIKSLVLDDIKFTSEMEQILSNSWQKSRIESLSLRNSSIKTLKEGAFSSYKNLQKLDLSDNCLAKLPRKVFNEKLKRIYLENNSLTEIPSDSLKSIKHLLHLYLKGNKISNITNTYFQADLIQSRIYKLHLENNGIHNLPIGSLQNVLEIDLSHNPLQNFTSLAFGNMSRILYITLTYNNLTQLTKSMIGGLAHLIELNVSHNQIMSIEKNIFFDELNLGRIDVSWNNLTGNFNVLLGNQQHLLGLYLIGNRIEKIDKDVFNESYSGILDIELNHNLLRDISTIPFRKMPRLKKLLLDDNLLTYILIDLFEENYELEIVSLRNNKILLSSGERVKNPIHCSCKPELSSTLSLLHCDQETNVSCTFCVKREQLLRIGNATCKISYNVELTEEEKYEMARRKKEKEEIARRKKEEDGAVLSATEEENNKKGYPLLILIRSVPFLFLSFAVLFLFFVRIDMCKKHRKKKINSKQVSISIILLIFHEDSLGTLNQLAT